MPLKRGLPLALHFLALRCFRVNKKLKIPLFSTFAQRYFDFHLERDTERDQSKDKKTSEPTSLALVDCKIVALSYSYLQVAKSGKRCWAKFDPIEQITKLCTINAVPERKSVLH